MIVQKFKEKLCSIIKKISSSSVTYFIIVFCFSITFYNFFIKKNNITEVTIIEKRNVFNFSSDKKYLECLYEQLHCYGEYAGKDRDTILKYCKEVTICESLSR